MIIRLFGLDRRSNHVIPSGAMDLLLNHGNPSLQAPQDDVRGRSGGQSRLFCAKIGSYYSRDPYM